jgi:hypothetical protein
MVGQADPVGAGRNRTFCLAADPVVTGQFLPLKGEQQVPGSRAGSPRC